MSRASGAPEETFERLTATNVTVKQLIQSAFELLESQILGADWIETEGYDLSARPAAASNFAQMQTMLQTMLAGRFKLQSHRETKDMPVYWLMVANGKPKLRDPKEEEAFNAAYAGKSPFRAGFHAMFTNKDLPGYAVRLARGIGRPVIDKTGIQGRYWFQLEWPQDDKPGIALPSLLTAVQEQLGRKLEKHMAPTEVLIVDSIERPADNY